MIRLSKILLFFGVCITLASSYYLPRYFAEKSLLSAFKKSERLTAENVFSFGWDKFSIVTGQDGELFAAYNCQLLSKEQLLERSTGTSPLFLESPYQFVFFEDGIVIRKIYYSLRVNFKFNPDGCFGRNASMVMVTSGDPAVILVEGADHD